MLAFAKSPNLCGLGFRPSAGHFAIATRSRASAGNQMFLVYLSDMAWLEATNLARKEEEQRIGLSVPTGTLRPRCSGRNPVLSGPFILQCSNSLHVHSVDFQGHRISGFSPQLAALFSETFDLRKLHIRLFLL